MGAICPRLAFLQNLALGAVLLAFASDAWAQDDVADSFNPGANLTVDAIVVQPDGKVIVGGLFTTLGGGGTGSNTRNHIGRLNADGTIDESFDPGANDAVIALALQSDGKILVGGSFTTLGGGGMGTVTRNNIGRLNADGSIDASFNPGTNGVVYALAVQTDGKILVGGDFGLLGGGGHSNIGRLEADGTVDATFNPNVEGPVFTLALQADEQILLGGQFNFIGQTRRDYIARLDSNGDLDPTFDPEAGGPVSALVVQADQKIVLGGQFTVLQGSGTNISRKNIARVNADGSVDAGFDPGADGGVFALALQEDQKILVGGIFDAMGGGTGTTARCKIGRVNPNGTLDSNFDPGAAISVNAITPQADGKILVGGLFQTLGGGFCGQADRQRIGRLAVAVAASGSRPLNISTRLDVLTSDEVLIGGFIITGTAPKKVLLRAIGPSLSIGGTTQLLADPLLELHYPDGSVTTNDNWMDTQAAEIEATGIPPTDDLESAIVATLDPGAYTAIVRGSGAGGSGVGTGVGLVEAYDLDPSPAASKLANISTRGFVQTGDNVMIGGFILGGGSDNSDIVLRGIGPSLKGLDGMADPQIELHDGNGAIVDSNDNWMDNPDMQTIIDDQLAPTDPLEAALIGSFAPGAYTVILSGTNNTTGIGLVEVYHLN